VISRSRSTWVHVLDVAAIERVGALSAAEWFAAREQVQRDFPTGIVVISYEVVPGQVLPTLALGDPEDDAHASFVFARYFTPGVHRARLDRIEHAMVELGRDSFTVRGQP
jgi:type VI secretion system protein